MAITPGFLYQWNIAYNLRGVTTSLCATFISISHSTSRTARVLTDSRHTHRRYISLEYLKIFPSAAFSASVENKSMLRLYREFIRRTCRTRLLKSRVWEFRSEARGPSAHRERGRRSLFRRSCVSSASRRGRRCWFGPFVFSCMLHALQIDPCFIPKATTARGRTRRARHSSRREIPAGVYSYERTRWPITCGLQLRIN